MHRQIGPLEEVLSQQAVGVLVGTPLPWALRTEDERTGASIDDIAAPIDSHYPIVHRLWVAAGPRRVGKRECLIRRPYDPWAITQ